MNLKEGIKTFHRRGTDLYIETGETSRTLTGDRDYRDDQCTKKTYVVRVWPTDDIWIEVKESDSGDRIADYRPFSHLEDIRNEENDDHGRERGPISVPGVHAPVGSPKLANTLVVHTHIDWSHLVQLETTQFNPAGEKPPTVPAEEFGELPLRWCSTCQYRESTPDEIRRKYES